MCGTANPFTSSFLEDTLAHSDKLRMKNNYHHSSVRRSFSWGFLFTYLILTNTLHHAQAENEEDFSDWTWAIRDQIQLALDDLKNGTASATGAAPSGGGGGSSNQQISNSDGNAANQSRGFGGPPNKSHEEGMFRALTDEIGRAHV